jgi:succinate dehydrogenase/fumarate reductase flavoprotein subunit
MAEAKSDHEGFDSIECDLLVIGSGAGGMTAAITARAQGKLDAIVTEKELVFGGTTALSGGYLWIPNNRLSQAAGVRDSVDAAREYIRHEAGNHFDGKRVDVFLRDRPRMVTFMHEHTAARFEAIPTFSDHHPDTPGGLAGGRSILSRPVSAAILGTDLSKLTHPLWSYHRFGKGAVALLPCDASPWLVCIHRGKPGVIAVVRTGHRFVYGANSYHDFVQAMVRACPKGEAAEAFLITGYATIRRYGLGYVKPAPLPLKHSKESGYLISGDTIAELARNASINAAGLEATIQRWNADVAHGEDRLFAKDSTAYNRFHGDPEVKPNPCLAPISKGPFYAVRLVPGIIGTFAGLRTDEHARVLDGVGRPIPGRYAAGNDMASILG